MQIDLRQLVALLATFLGTLAHAAPQVDAEAAFAELIEMIVQEHACANARELDFTRLATEARQRLGERPSDDAVIQEMQRIVAALGDGHAGIGEFESTLPRVFMPVLLARAEHGIVAFHPDRSALLDADRPYVKAIDQIPLEQWLNAAAAYVPNGSPQLVQERSLRLLRFVGFMGEQMGCPPSDVMWIELSNADGSDSVSLRLKTASRKPIFGEWPRVRSRILEGNIGYLRIAEMSADDDELDSLRHMAEHCIRERAVGMIIDVRGNSGGSRDAMHALLPYFMTGADQPEATVVNVAKRRLRPGELDGQQRLDALANRGLFPAAWPDWSEGERHAIDEFAAAFQPKCELPRDVPLSDWHYAVVRRMPPDRDAPLAFRGPVVLLIDNVSFSATDVFAAAFAQLPNITLIGSPTAGGSARARPHKLRSVEASVRLGTMYSFQPSGEPYDGVGVEPDVVVYPSPTYFITGGEDAQLTHAIGVIEAATRD